MVGRWLGLFITGFMILTISRYQRINDPDGNELDRYNPPYNSALIEKLDGRNPLFKKFKYRFTLRGRDVCQSFVKWMTENFGAHTSYGHAKTQLKFGGNIDNVRWVLNQEITNYYYGYHIYFDKECEVLIRLKFMNGGNF